MSRALTLMESSNLRQVSAEFNQIKADLDEALKVPPNGGGEATAMIVENILGEWKLEFDEIQGVYKEIAGIKEGEPQLLE